MVEAIYAITTTFAMFSQAITSAEPLYNPAHANAGFLTFVVAFSIFIPLTMFAIRGLISLART